MTLPVLTTAAKIAAVNDLTRPGGTLAGLIMGLASNPSPPTANLALSDVVPCVFTGYAAVPGQNLGLAALEGDAKVHARGPSFTFVGTDGAAQRLSTTVNGPVTTAGNATVVVTAAGMTGSPRTVTVAVLTTDTDAELAEKVEEALAADADVGPFFGVTSTGNTLTLERRAAAANDAAMNVSVADGTSVGIAARPTARQDRPGVAPGGTYTADTARMVYATDAGGTVLKWAQQLDTPISFGAVGSGGTASLDYVYGA